MDISIVRLVVCPTPRIPWFNQGPRTALAVREEEEEEPRVQSETVMASMVVALQVSGTLNLAMSRC